MKKFINTVLLTAIFTLLLSVTAFADTDTVTFTTDGNVDVYNMDDNIVTEVAAGEEVYAVLKSNVEAPEGMYFTHNVLFDDECLIEYDIFSTTESEVYVSAELAERVPIELDLSSGQEITLTNDLYTSLKSLGIRLYEDDSENGIDGYDLDKDGNTDVEIIYTEDDDGLDSTSMKLLDDLVGNMEYNYSFDATSGMYSNITFIVSQDSDAKMYLNGELTEEEVPETVNIEVVADEGGAATGGGEVEVGKEITLYAYAENGYEFAGWYVGDELISVINQYKMTAEKDVTFRAAFTKTEKVFNVALNVTGEGTVTGNGEYTEGSEVTVTAAAGENYHFAGWFADSELLSSEESYTFTAEKDVTLEARFEKDAQRVITASDFKKYALKNKTFSVTVKDQNDQPVAEEDVTISYNNKTATVKTDENGVASLKIGKLPAGTYDVNVTCGDVSESVKMQVVKNTTKITAKSTSTFKKAAKKTYKVKLTSAGTKLTNQVVKLKIGNKVYKAKTNSKGQAAFKLKLNAKKTYKAKIVYGGSKYSKSKSKTVKIIVK